MQGSSVPSWGSVSDRVKRDVELSRYHGEPTGLEGTRVCGLERASVPRHLVRGPVRAESFDAARLTCCPYILRFVVRLDGDEDVTVKARASNLKVIRSQCGGSPPDDSPSAASPSPALNHREDDVGPATQPESSAGNDRNTGTPEEALGRWLCADVFESFVYSNSLDPDGSETHKLLQVARVSLVLSFFAPSQNDRPSAPAHGVGGGVGAAITG